MKKVSLVLVAILILLSGMLPGCNGSLSDRELIDKMRDEAYFGITPDEASDEELFMFLQDEPNRIFVETTIRQITFGQKVDNPQAPGRISAGKEFFDFMTKKTTAIGLERFLNVLTGPSILGPMAGNLLVIIDGAKTFLALAAVLKKQDEINLIKEYIILRSQGESEERTYDLTINDPIYEPIVNKILKMEQAWKVWEIGEVPTEERKEALWEYFEACYQSWEIANNENKRLRIKWYILDWIEEHRITPSLEIAKWVYETDASPTCVAISSNGYIVVGSSESVCLLNSNKNLLWTYQTDFPITDVSARADGSRVVAGGLKEDVIISDGIVYYLNNQGELVFSYEPPGVSSVSLSPEGDYYAVTCVHGLGWCDQVNFWGFNEEEWLWYHGFAMDETTSVSVSADGEYVAVGGSQGPLEDGGLCLYNKSGNVLWDYDEINKKELGYDKYSVAISSNGNYIVAGHEGEDNLYFFNKEGELLWKYNTGYIKGVSILDEGIIIAAASSDKVYLFDRGILDDFSLRGTLEIENIEDISISNEANLLVVATADNKVYAFDLKKVLH